MTAFGDMTTDMQARGGGVSSVPGRDAHRPAAVIAPANRGMIEQDDVSAGLACALLRSMADAMEHLVEALRAIAGISSSEARLALLVIVDELRGVLSEADALELAAALPLELALLVARDQDDDEWDFSQVEEEREAIGARTITAVCQVLASEVHPAIAERLTGDLPARLSKRLGAGHPVSATWTLIDSTRPTVRVERGATSRPTLPARAC